MSGNKTRLTAASVDDFLASVKRERRREDGRSLLSMMQAVTGEDPKMWGNSIIGFGIHEYKLASGKTEQICKIGFSPRSSALVLYLGVFPSKEALLARLGKHKRGSGCIYINNLTDVDEAVLKEMFREAYRH